MTELEEMQMAHKWLNILRKQATPGDWYEHDGLEGDGEPLATRTDLSDMPYPAYWRNDTDVNLIVVLHRTIDAQLDFLHDRINDMIHTTMEPDVYALGLARAINGEAS